jgi:hypothetical protein
MNTQSNKSYDGDVDSQIPEPKPRNKSYGVGA